MSLTVGQMFPVDIAVDSARGTLRLSEMLGDGSLVVAFHRLWCPFCQQAARELAAAKGEFDALGARVVIVYRDSVDFVLRACARRATPFDCVCDTHGELTAAANVEPFSRVRYWAFSPRKLVKALRSGSHVDKTTTRLLEGRATFVLDGNARIVYAHTSVNAADIPPIRDILAAVQSVTQPTR
ncbi:MAG TPA: redoxin domain-containing protein [Mycobacterium sp.]